MINTNGDIIMNNFIESEVTHPCGHSSIFKLAISNRNNKAMLESVAQKPCGDCLLKAKEQKRKEERETHEAQEKQRAAEDLRLKQERLSMIEKSYKGKLIDLIDNKVKK